MELFIDNEQRSLIEIKKFREEWNLPDSFSIDLYESKDFENTGKLEKDTELEHLTQAVMEMVPDHITLNNMLTVIDRITLVFKQNFALINETINLKTVEIDFATAGFQDVLYNLYYKLLEARTQGKNDADFEKIYALWLNDSVRVTRNAHNYVYQDQTWQVQSINTIYGRVGLKVTTPDGIYYVHDPKLACPAESYMYRLLKRVSAKIQTSIQL